MYKTTPMQVKMVNLDWIRKDILGDNYGHRDGNYEVKDIIYSDFCSWLKEHPNDQLGGILVKDEAESLIDCFDGNRTDSMNYVFLKNEDGTIKYDSDSKLPDVEYLILDVYEDWIDLTENMIDFAVEEQYED